jgi:hypothetical protein
MTALGQGKQDKNLTRIIQWMMYQNNALNTEI